MAANASPRAPNISPSSQADEVKRSASAERIKTFTWHQLDKDILRPFVEHGHFNLHLGDGQICVLPIDGLLAKNRVVTAEELRERLQELVQYKLPWAAEQGVPESVDKDANTREMAVTTSCAHKLWNDIRRLGLAGLLGKFPPEDMEGLVAGIKEHIYGGKYSLLSWTPIRLAPQEVNSEKKVTARAGTKRKAAVKKAPTPRESLTVSSRSIVNDEGAAPRASPPMTASPPTAASPREARQLLSPPQTTPSSGDAEDDDFEGGTRAKRPRKAGKAGKNARPGKAAADQGHGALFGANLKKALSHRNRATDAVNPFSDAILPGSEPVAGVDTVKEFENLSRRDRATIGDTTGLHAQEIELCALADLSAAQYRCQKARIFLGLACFIGYNEHRRAEEPATFTSLQQFGKTQLQQACNIDVNKGSKLFLGFTAFGWLGDKSTDKSKDIPKAWLERFPRAHREKLLREMRAWELLEEERKMNNPGDEKLQQWQSSILQRFQLDG